MAIIGPSDLPFVLKVDSNPLKFHAISVLGHPVVNVEITEPQLEQILRSMGDFIAQYFPQESRYAFFQTIPLQHTYDLPEDAYWIREVAWDPTTTRIDDIFGAECISRDSIILTPNGNITANDLQIGNKVLSYKNGEIIESEVIARKESGLKYCYKVKTRNGELIATLDHRFMTNYGWKKLEDVLEFKKELLVYNDNKFVHEEIKSIDDIGKIETIDFQIADAENFITGNIVTHNSFLFCLPGGTQLLTDDGPKTCEECYDKLDDLRLLTPFGHKKFSMRWNEKKQPISMIKTMKGGVVCTPNHPVNIDNKWNMAMAGCPGTKLLSSSDKQIIVEDYGTLSTDGTWSIDIPSGCYYAGLNDEELYLIH